ncbi:MAG: TusE/DsrC/DsvC family sulfur relay protein [Prolixibacteraceae bacterium]|nr:TusE/DsrC/DsvC family sulfur relay protein [Prolixibacteraceae bacterium]
MANKEIAGKTVDVNADGYLNNPSQWDKDVAIEIAKEEGIELSNKHYEVIEFLRKTHESGETLTIRKVGKSGITDIKGFYELFPGGPLKISSKIAGIPKPSSCV